MFDGDHFGNIWCPLVNELLLSNNHQMLLERLLIYDDIERYHCFLRCIDRYTKLFQILYKYYF